MILFVYSTLYISIYIYTSGLNSMVCLLLSIRYKHIYIAIGKLLHVDADYLPTDLANLQSSLFLLNYLLNNQNQVVILRYRPTVPHHVQTIHVCGRFVSTQCPIMI